MSGNSPTHALPRSPADDRRFMLALAGLLLCYFSLSLYHVGDLPLIDPDEPRYAAAGRSMADGASLLVPQFNGKERINKPPLFYWLVAASMKVLGPCEAAARLPSIIAGMAMLLLTVWAGCRLFDRATALLAGGILLTMPLFMVMSRICTTDAVMSAFVGGALFLFILHDVGKLPARRTLLWATVLLGLAYLTKATPVFATVLCLVIYRALEVPPSERPRSSTWIPWLLLAALLLSLAAFVCELEGKEAAKAYNRRATTELKAESIAPASESVLKSADAGLRVGSALAALSAVVLIFQIARRSPGGLRSIRWSVVLIPLALGAWWYASLIWRFGLDRFVRLINEEVAGRMAGEMHRQPMHYYLPIVMAMTLPWAPALLSALRNGWNTGVVCDEKRAERFLTAWLLGTVLFFSIPNAKLAYYVLPAMPAAALLISRYLRSISAAPASAAWRGTTHTLAALSVLSAVGLTVYVVAKAGVLELKGSDYIVQLSAFDMVLFLLLCAGLLLGWGALLRGRAALGVLVLVVMMLTLSLLGFPSAMDGLERRSSRLLCQEIAAQVTEAQRFVSFGTEAESLPYYLNRIVLEGRRRDVTRNEQFVDVIKEELDRPEKVVVFIEGRYCARMMKISRDEFEKMPQSELSRQFPANSQFVARRHDLVVLRNFEHSK